MDSQLGEVTGVSLAKSIRDFEGNKILMMSWFLKGRIEKNTPIISVSGNSIAKQKADYGEIHISDFLMKPITKANLISSIQKTLNI